MNLTDDDRALSELRAAVATRREDSIASAVKENIWPLYSAHYDELIAVVEALPNGILDRNPMLRVLHRTTPVLARTTRPFKPLIGPDAAQSMDPDELDLLTLVQMVAFRFSGDVAAALIYARRLSDRIVQAQSESRQRTDGPLWFYHQQIGSTLLAAGDTAQALIEFAASRRIGRLSNQPDAERMSLGRAALAHAVRGSLHEAELALRELSEQPLATAAHVVSSTMTELTARALVDVDTLAPDAEKRVDLLDPYGSLELTWPFGLLARARFLLAHHRPEEALEAVRLADDAHPEQHGSFASDVINSVYIEAFWAVGATNTARRIAASTASAGVLTRFAIVRQSLHQSRPDVAAHGIRRLAAEPLLGPTHRAELVLLHAWRESIGADAADAETARNVARLATQHGMRRLLSSVPLQVFDHVRAHLSSPEAELFDIATAGLAPTDAPRRPVLTAGEMRVLSALHVHPTTASIASSFHVSPNTIKSQLTSLYRKLGCSSKDDAVKITSRLHLLVSEVD